MSFSRRAAGIAVARWSREGSPRLTNAALLLFGALMLVFCRAGVFEYSHFRFGLSADIFGQLILYLGAIALIERGPTDKWTLPIVLIMALLARLICVFHPAFLSTDVYRYVWDGKVQAAGINPFRYIPADGHLNFLRDSAIYPHINRRDYARTIYPPGAQAIFFAVTRLSATVSFMKLAMVGFEAGTCLVLIRILLRLQMPKERVLLYAWNPLCFWEIASSGHVDAAALTFLALALYAAMREKPVQSGAWLGGAALVKLYPMVLLPALLGASLGKREWRSAALTGAAMAGVIAAGYACYASVGAGVFGFLPTYAQEEGLETGGRYFPLTLVNRLGHAAVTPGMYVAACALLLAGISLWLVRRCRRPEQVILSALVLATCMNLCYSPHYPWYFLWLLPCLTVYPWRPAFYLVSAATFLFATQLGAAGQPMFLLNKLLYGGFFLMLLLDRLAQNAAPRVGAGQARPLSRNAGANLLADPLLAESLFVEPSADARKP